jgi:hypothetical protein
MNRLIATACMAASALVAGHVFADDITPSEPFVSTADRAQVQAQLAASRTQSNPWSIAYDPLTKFHSSRTRAEVTSEYVTSREEVAAVTGEDSGSFALTQQQVEDSSSMAGLRSNRTNAQ